MTRRYRMRGGGDSFILMIDSQQYNVQMRCAQFEADLANDKQFWKYICSCCKKNPNIESAYELLHVFTFRYSDISNIKKKFVSHISGGEDGKGEATIRMREIVAKGVVQLKPSAHHRITLINIGDSEQILNKIITSFRGGVVTYSEPELHGCVDDVLNYGLRHALHEPAVPELGVGQAVREANATGAAPVLRYIGTEI